ncbi:CLUMA_CG015496, isoform A [Clunio marinus]|uniref:CLUMA_CG015496, isoform A n=1 Tax=Clunio marinus TaxID=568069 RepID=A0A1J1ISD6_9DIPT|nr:CLUMA_CG015496, isoform A [Clunio marinus]
MRTTTDTMLLKWKFFSRTHSQIQNDLSSNLFSNIPTLNVIENNFVVHVTSLTFKLDLETLCIYLNIYIRDSFSAYLSLTNGVTFNERLTAS